MIVVDTHVWVWWVSGSKKVPVRVRRRIERAARVGVCAISCWELATLVLRKRLTLDRTASSWIGQALKAPRVELLPLEPDIAVGAASLGIIGGDPADHMIVATARHHGAPLVTADANIADSGMIEVIW